MKIFAFALLLACSAVNAQTFIQGTAYGDSPEKVQQLLPEGTVLKSDASDRARGISKTYHVPIRLVERQFDGFFYFDMSNGLESVVLRARVYPSQDDADAVFFAVGKVLTEKYGKTSKVGAMSNSAKFYYAWRLKDKDIVLGQQDGDTPVTVGYVQSDKVKDRKSKADQDKYQKSLKIKEEAAKL